MLFTCLLYFLSIWGTIANDVEDRVERKVFEICRIVRLTDEQIDVIRDAYRECVLVVDSAMDKVNSVNEAMSLKYVANKKFNKVFMATLNEKQRYEYICVCYTPEITEKTEYRIMLLKEKSECTEVELQKLRKEIFSYLMVEKVVYIRDKYDLPKQKNNIRRLKNVQPSSMKESDILEKIKFKGRLNKGKISW